MREVTVKELKERFAKRYTDLLARSRLRGIALVDKNLLWEKVVASFQEGFRCYYCGCALHVRQPRPSPQVFSLDHYLPFALGGKNTVENIVICCHSCNIIKGTMRGGTFEELLHYIPVELKEKMFDEIYRGRLADKLDRVKNERGEIT